MRKILKKTLSVFTCIPLILSTVCFNVSAAGQKITADDLTLTVETVDIEYADDIGGTVVEIPVELSGIDCYSSYGFHVYYDEQLDCILDSDDIYEDFSVDIPDTKGVFCCKSLAEVDTTSEPLLTLKMRLPQNVSKSTYPVWIEWKSSNEAIDMIGGFSENIWYLVEESPNLISGGIHISSENNDIIWRTFVIKGFTSKHNQSVWLSDNGIVYWNDMVFTLNKIPQSLMYNLNNTVYVKNQPVTADSNSVRQAIIEGYDNSPNVTDAFYCKHCNCIYTNEKFDICKGMLKATANDSEYILSSKVKGDIDNNGVLGINDIVLLQKWLLGREISLPVWENADMDNNSILNIYDMIIIRQAFIEQNTKL